MTTAQSRAMLAYQAHQAQQRRQMLRWNKESRRARRLEVMMITEACLFPNFTREVRSKLKMMYRPSRGSRQHLSEFAN